MPRSIPTLYCVFLYGAIFMAASVYGAHTRPPISTASQSWASLPASTAKAITLAEPPKLQAAGLRDFTWTGLVSSFWADPMNWLPTNGPPNGASDGVTIGPNASIILTDDVSVRRLVTAGSIVGDDFSITVQVDGIWSGGTINISNLVIRTLPPPPEIDLPFELPIDFEIPWPGFDIVGGIHLQQCDIINFGWVRWTGRTNWHAGNNLFINNGRFDINSDQLLDRLVLINNGLVKKKGIQEQSAPVAMTNNGTFAIHSGWMDFSDHPLQSTNRVVLGENAKLVVRAGGFSGVVTLEQNAKLDLRAGTVTLADVAITGPGAMRLLDWNSYVRSHGQVSANNIDILDGNLGVGGVLDISGRVGWTNGMISGTGLVNLQEQALLEIGGPDQKTLQELTLANAGTIRWSDSGPLVGHNGPVLSNKSNGLIEVTSTASLNRFNHPLVLKNEGTFRFGSAGAKTMEASIENRGNFEVLDGELSITADFNNHARTALSEGSSLDLKLTGTNTARFELANQSRLRFSGGTHHLQAGAEITGEGAAVLVSGALRIDDPVMAENFQVLNGELEDNGSLTIQNSLNWEGGIIKGTAQTIINTNATLLMAGGSPKTLLAHRVSNHGTIRWTGPGTLTGHNAPTIDIDTNALFEVETDAAILRFNAPLSVNNHGIVRFLSAQPQTIEADFNNDGGVEAYNGVFTFTAAFNNRGALIVSSNANVHLNLFGTNRGAFVVDQDSTVNFNGRHVFETGTAIRGAGVAALRSGELQVEAAVRTSNFDLLGGQVNCSGNLWILGTMRWEQGILAGSGLTTIDRGATLILEGSGQKTLLNHAMDNSGTIEWRGSGPLVGHDSPILHNRVGGLVQVRGNAPLNRFNAPLLFRNDGTFRFESDATNTMETILTNAGTVRVSSGSLVMTGPFSNNGTTELDSGATLDLSAAGTNSGAFTLNGFSNLRFSGGRHYLHDGVTIEGPGFATLARGNLEISGSAPISNLEVVSGEVNTTGTLSIGTSLRWTGGTLAGPGVTRIDPGANLHITGPTPKLFLAHSIENAGTVLWTGTGDINGHTGPVIRNLESGIFQISTDASLTRFNNAAKLENAGYVQKFGTAGTTFMEMDVANSGIIDVASGKIRMTGSLTNSSSAQVITVIGGTSPITNFSQIEVTGPVHLDGRYRLILTNGFVPDVGHEFDVITASTVTGRFAQLDGTGLANREFLPLYRPASFSLSVTNAIPPIELSVRRLADMLNLEWPLEHAGRAQLETTEDLRTNQWRLIDLPIGTNRYVAPMTKPREFFRLRAP